MAWMNIYRKKRKGQKTWPVPPETQLLLDELCDTLKKLKIEVRQEVGYFRGGLCIVDEQKIFFINKSNPVDQNIDLLLTQLKKEDLGNIFISPRLRSHLDTLEYKIEA
jgi:transposase